MRTKAVEQESLGAILRLLTPQNRLACLVAVATGLRIGDVLRLKTADLHRERFAVQESKTGKRKIIYIPEPLKRELLRYSGALYVFPNRLTGKRTRTRQAVWKDLARCSKLLHLRGVAPHSMRKTYARTLRAYGVSEYRIQQALNHQSPIITQLYLMADEVALK